MIYDDDIESDALPESEAESEVDAEGEADVEEVEEDELLNDSDCADYLVLSRQHEQHQHQHKHQPKLVRGRADGNVEAEAEAQHHKDYYLDFMSKLRQDGIPIDELVAALGDDEDEEDENYEPDDLTGSEDDEDYDSHAEEEEDDDDDDESGARAVVHDKEVRELVRDCLMAVTDPPIVSVDRGITCSSTSDDRGSSSLSNCLPASSTSAFFNNVVTSMIAGKESEICIDNIPVSAIRKIVARQMSMALQLLIQILLQAESRSEVWKNAYNYLLNFANLRESAMKRATLMEMNLINIATLRNLNNGVDHQRQQTYSHSHPLYPQLTSHVAFTTIVPPSSNKRMTRSQTNSSMQGRSSSIFDIPALSHVSSLMILIDSARSRISQLQSILLGNKVQPSSTLSIVHHRSDYLSLFNQELVKLYAQLNLKLWQCIVPTRNYPFKYNYSYSSDPCSATGRIHFSPAEDDLLLRGVISCGEEWDMITTKYLPCKDRQMVEFRYRQRIHTGSDIEFNDLKRYKQLERNKSRTNMRGDRWSLIEELNLFRGFQVFGNKWPLVILFCLPHLSISIVSNHWAELQRLWARIVPSTHDSDVAATTMTDRVRTFLNDLNACLTMKSYQEFLQGDTPKKKCLQSQSMENQDFPSAQRSALLASAAHHEFLLEQAFDTNMIDEDELDDSEAEQTHHFQQPHDHLYPVLVYNSQTTPALSFMNTSASTNVPFPVLAKKRRFEVM